MREPHVYEVRVKEVIQRNYNVTSIRVEHPGFAFKAGQFTCVALETEGECKRYLSISSSPTETGYIEFTKKLTGSDFSKALCELKPGTVVKLQQPMGLFTFEGAPRKIAFLSGGIGITPIRSMCKYAVDKKLDIEIVLVYANRSIGDIVFKDDFDAMQRGFPKLRVAHVLCEPAPGFKCTVGLINAQIVKNEVPDFAERRFYLCGPPAMVEIMREILAEELRLPQLQIVTERFKGY